jgi:hypothetical protein
MAQAENRLLQAEVAELKTELERERIRLAACGSAALGYYDGCKDEYKSASLDDVLRLRKDAERWRFQNSLPDLSPYLREYHSGVLLSTEDIDAALKEAQS